MNKYQEILERITINYCATCENFDCEKNKLKKVECDCPFQEDINDLQELVDENKKLKEAIKVISNYFSVSDEFGNYEMYSSFPDYVYIKKEEFELLKEVFEDVKN